MQHKKIAYAVRRLKNVVAELYTAGDIAVFFFGKNLLVNKEIYAMNLRIP